jgi:hypothetical protein
MTCSATYDRVGDVQGNPGSANLGDIESAITSYRKAEAALEYARRAIERAGSPNPGYLHTLGWAHYRQVT